MCGCKFAIATDVRCHHDFACGCLGADYFARILKVLSDLHAKVNDHCCFATSSVMVKKAIMTISSKAFMLPQKIPDKVKRRLPCSTNLPDAHMTSHRGERLRVDRLSYNLISHRVMPIILVERAR